MVKRFVFDPASSHSLASAMRMRRMVWLAQYLRGISGELERKISLLDLGGTIDFWDNAKLEMIKDVTSDLVIANIAFRGDGHGHKPVRISQVEADARNLKEFGDCEFDVCFSNSVIEHVGGFEHQYAMAREVQRVAKYYFVQTPYKFFPIEPHYVRPLMQFVPLEIRARMLVGRKIGWMGPAKDLTEGFSLASSINLLSISQMKCLFPGSRILKEKFLGIVKSIVALKPLPCKQWYWRGDA